MEHKIATSVEQSKKLIEFGIDVNTADMHYYKDSFGYYIEGLYNSKDLKDGCELKGIEYIPAWSLTALIELMPDKISINNESYYLYFTKKSVEFRGPITWDGQKTKSFEMDNILDVVFEIVYWLKENNKI